MGSSPEGDQQQRPGTDQPPQTPAVYLACVIVACTIVAILCLKALSHLVQRKKRTKLSALDVLHLLQQTKPFPIEPAQRWRLLGLHFEHRVWGLRILSSCHAIIDVYGSFTKLKAAPSTVLTTLHDVTKYCDWDWSINAAHNVTGSHDNQEVVFPRTKGGANLPVRHDVISIQVDYIPSRIIRMINWMSLWIQGDILLKKSKIYNRFWYREENGCCWLLECDQDLQEWTFFLVQPIDGWFEMDQCLLTVVCSHNSRRPVPVPLPEEAIPALKVASLQNYFLHRKLQCTPLTTLTLPREPDTPKMTSLPDQILASSVLESSGSNLKGEDREGVGGADTATATAQTPTRPTASARAKTFFGDISKFVNDEHKSEPTWIDKMKNLIEEKKGWYEARKSKMAAVSGTVNKVSSSPAKKTDVIASGILQDACGGSGSGGGGAGSTPPRRVKQRLASKGLTRRTWAGGEEDCEEASGEDASVESDGSTPSRGSMAELSSSGSRRAGGKAPLVRSNTATADLGGGGAGVGAGAGEDGPAEGATLSVGQKLKKRLWLDRKRVVRSLDDTDADRGTPKPPLDSLDPGQADNSVVSSDADSQEWVFQELVDRTVKELLSQKSKVSQVDISRSYEDQADQTGGWIYCGLEKDVVVMRKLFDEESKVQSFLGKGLIQCDPKIVFEALQNPRTRFTYDSMLRNLDVLHDFGDGRKVVYMYHEVSQLFKKENRDFCVLQSERKQGSKYIICLNSISWPGCEVKPEVVRGQFHASGWIIEPAVRDNKLFSMVTYMVQIELGYSKTNTGYLIEDLAVKQPTSIAFLRRYLLPSNLPSRSHSAGSLYGGPRHRRKHSAHAQENESASPHDDGSTLATIAAAAAAAAVGPTEKVDEEEPQEDETDKLPVFAPVEC